MVDEYFFHVTKEENFNSIMNQGLKSGEEGIFVFTYEDRDLADVIARHQVGLDEYMLLAIHEEGVQGEVIDDNVAELMSPFQKIIVQTFIHADYIESFGVFKVQKKWLYPESGEAFTRDMEQLITRLINEMLPPNKKL